MAEDIPYIGSRISLISKSDIRYEGVLFTIDMEQSSIALKDGKINSMCTGPDSTYSLGSPGLLYIPLNWNCCSCFTRH